MEAEDAAEKLDERHVAKTTSIAAAHAWSPSDAPDTQANIDADDTTSKPIESVASRRARRIARTHLRTLASRYGLEARDVDALEHRDTYVGDGSGARVVRFRQVVGGRTVVGREVSVILNGNEEPAGVTGRLAPSVALRRAELAESRAVRSARDAVTAVVGDSVRALAGGAARDFDDFTSSRAGGPLDHARVRPVLFERDGELVPAHQVDLELRAEGARAAEVASASADDAYYFGLRRVPYSTDKSRNALSFQHVVRGATLPAGAPMRASDPAANALPHNAGEVWGTALWECYVSLLQAHPFMEAQDRMRRYLVASLRAMPFEPTFTEAAEALRIVTSAYDPADEHRFVAAFAKRGLGVGATSASRTSTDLVGLSESGLTGGGLRVVAISLDDSDKTCDGDGVLDLGESGRLRVTIENVGRSIMNGVTAQVTAQGTSAPLDFPNGNTLTFPSVNAGARVSTSIPITLTSAGAGAPADVRISFSAPVVPSSTVSFRTPVHHDESISSTTDTMSTRRSTLAFERNGVRAPFVATHDADDDFAHLEDGPTRGTYALVTGPLAVTSQLGVSFRMRHSLVLDESSAPLDGAVVEISEDGVHFEDVTKSGANAGYGGSLPAGTTNPIGARPAYTGMSAGFPAFVTRSIDLGNAYVGKTVVLRFRIGAASSNKSAYGFDVDDLTVTGVVDARSSFVHVWTAPDVARRKLTRPSRRC